MPRPLAESREAYPHFLAIQTRWSDNDVYGHVNNTVYYSYFDTVVNRYLIEQGVLDPTDGEVIGLVVATHCDYFSEVAFPDLLSAGLRIAHLGNSSVRYEIGLFRNEKAALRRKDIWFTYMYNGCRDARRLCRRRYARHWCRC